MTGRWWSAGSVLAALAGATCCLGPLVFTTLGLSSFVSLWILRHLVPYRNLFFLITIVLLGLGFYATYRRHRQTRVRDKAMVWGSTLLVLALVGYSLYIEGFVLYELPG
jgi:hypothetical protein